MLLEHRGNVYKSFRAGKGRSCKFYGGGEVGLNFEETFIYSFINTYILA